MSAAGGVSCEDLFEAANVSLVRIDSFLKLFVGSWLVSLRLLSILVALMGFFLPAMVLMPSLRRRICQLKLDFLMSFVRALPTFGLALGVQGNAGCSLQSF